MLNHGRSCGSQTHRISQETDGLVSDTCELDTLHVDVVRITVSPRAYTYSCKAHIVAFAVPESVRRELVQRSCRTVARHDVEHADGRHICAVTCTRKLKPLHWCNTHQPTSGVSRFPSRCDGTRCECRAARLHDTMPNMRAGHMITNPFSTVHGCKTRCRTRGWDT